MKTSILDFGNAFLKSTSTDSPFIDIKPSCIYYLTRADIRNKVQGNDDSPLIQLPDGRVYLLGDAAAAFNGANNYSLDSKLSVTLEGLYASHSISGTIDRLIVCVPDSSIDIDLTPLIGHHSYLYNGSSVYLQISSIEVVDESLGAFKSAQSNLFNYPDENNVVVTCGGGTANLVVYNGGGNIIHRAVSKELGMASLAKSIATELKSVYNLSTTPKISQIMANIAAGVFNLRPHQLDYTAMFEVAKGEWKQQFRRFINENLADVDYCEFVVVGGGAELLRSDSLTPGIFIPTNAQTHAIEGMLNND